MEKLCKGCDEVKPIDSFAKKKGYKDGVYSRCRSCTNAYVRNLRKRDDVRERLNNATKRYYEKNKAKVNEQRRKYQKKRRHTDPLFKIKHLLRGLTYKAFYRNGYSKNTKTRELLGCDWEVCKKHIENQFTDGMSWENQGEWHIDHIIPLASAKKPSDLKFLCHYTNLQPLWAKDNLSKGSNTT